MPAELQSYSQIVGAILREQREAQEIERTEFATQMNRPAIMWGNIESGEVVLGLNDFRRACLLLKMDPALVLIEANARIARGSVRCRP